MSPNFRVQNSRWKEKALKNYKFPLVIPILDLHTIDYEKYNVLPYLSVGGLNPDDK